MTASGVSQRLSFESLVDEDKDEDKGKGSSGMSPRAAQRPDQGVAGTGTQHENGLPHDVGSGG
jgi:hypothetical protein